MRGGGEVRGARLCGVSLEREECFREDFFGFELREVVGGFREAPSWGSAFPGGGGGGPGESNLSLTSSLGVVLISIMKTANIADLRNNFRLIASWISDGESVEIKKRGQHFATLIPSARAEARPMPKIDFAGRLKKIWGDRVFSDQEVAEMRMAELEGEEG